MNKIVFNYMDMRAISLLERGHNLLNMYIKSGKDNHNEGLMFFDSTVGVIEVIKKSLDKSNINYEEKINDVIQILLNRQDFKLVTYSQALKEFIDYLNDKGNNVIDENDNTLGKEFNIDIQNRKFNENLNINIIKTKNGWRIYNSERNIKRRCDKFCRDGLYNLLDNFAVSYPNDLDGYLKWLWEASTVFNYTEQEVCEEFKEISKWINLCNEYSPNTLLGGYK